VAYGGLKLECMNALHSHQNLARDDFNIRPLVSFVIHLAIHAAANINRIDIIISITDVSTKIPACSQLSH
jgi:hypothetical protein